ncbi:dihydrodipicolinate synthase family protein [Pandoraea anhela]|uniref:ABC transporter permease n=1 Tax=Pandoraea anhela TaxID=2508295 RepID=A0A5E4YRY9_9BURK|nr:dihydrodipicolinate synthase family protein [Pandoraea anhela]VVE51195.1 ABC transporter permease [Pandoraea anhela]
MTLHQRDLKGMFPALPTPMNAAGEIDLERLSVLVATLIDEGVAGLVPVGGSGEYTALSPEDRVRVVATTVEAARGRVPVIPGILSPGYDEALSNGRRFVEVGAAGLLLVTPYYVTPTDQGVRAYFRKYRQIVGVPLLLYDIPARTRYATPPATVAAMGSDDGCIIGMKACNPDLGLFAQTVQMAKNDVAVMSGDDLLYVHHVLLGATGGILSSAGLLPRFWNDIHRLASNGEVGRASAEHSRLVPALHALFREPNPGPVKAAFGLIGDPVGEVRLPLIPPRAQTLEAVKKELAFLLDNRQELNG